MTCAPNTQLFDVFFTSTELLVLAVIDSLILVGQKRDPDKTQVVLCSCAGFVLLSRTVPHLFIGNWFRMYMYYAENEAFYPEAFYRCSNNLFAWSEILENGLLCGGVRGKRSMATLMDFAIRAIVLSRKRVKKLQTNIQFFL